MNRENFKVYKANIIGGGFAGMVLAIALAKEFGGDNIMLLEGNDRLGKKVLSTGNGQCNITNKNVLCGHYHGNNINFENNVLSEFSQQFLISFFKDLGLYIMPDGDKYYPLSRQASSVLDALRFKISSLKINVKLNSKAIGTNREKYFITTLENGEKIYSENLIIATGGKSAKHTGSDGNGYNLAKSFNHNITPLYPSLVQLKCDKEQIKGLKGLKQYSKLSGEIGGKIVCQTEGDVLFTDYGVSGNATFYVSAYLSGKQNKSVIIDLCPQIDKNELIDFLNYKVKNCSYLKIEDLFSGIINKKVALAVLKNKFDVRFDDDVSKINVVKAVEAVKNFKLAVLGDTGFDNSQVTRGGVDVVNVDDKSMQSKLVKGLYFAGEILDVDGDCGGYNLQWAFSSAMAVAKSIIGKN